MTAGRWCRTSCQVEANMQPADCSSNAAAVVISMLFWYQGRHAHGRLRCRTPPVSLCTRPELLACVPLLGLPAAGVDAAEGATAPLSARCFRRMSLWRRRRGMSTCCPTDDAPTCRQEQVRPWTTAQHSTAQHGRAKMKEMESSTAGRQQY